MTARRVLAALLARIFPGRGRHRQQPPSDDDTLVFPKVPDPDDPPPHWLTRLDLPPGRARPYVEPGDDDEGGQGGWLP